MDSNKNLAAKAVLELDGSELELIIQELKRGIILANEQEDYFRVLNLNVIMNHCIVVKRDFHQKWNDFLSVKYNK